MSLCDAIAARSVIRFYYSIGREPGYRTVEPHMVAYTNEDKLALSGWYLSGASESDGGPGWRIYLYEGISKVEMQPRTFTARPGYKRDGGKSFHNIRCAL